MTNRERLLKMRKNEVETVLRAKINAMTDDQLLDLMAEQEQKVRAAMESGLVKQSDLPWQFLMMTDISMMEFDRRAYSISHCGR
jgi:hypothetical protein